MSTELTTNKDTTAPTSPINNDLQDDLAAFAAAANQNLSSSRLGPLLTFKKGKFLYGKKKIEMALGTELIAIIAETRHGYVKWSNGKIVKNAIWRVAERPLLDRNEMGETEENQWPISEMTGRPEDPYQHVISVPMVSLDGTQIYTFSTHYFYGREAAYGLLKKYAAQGAQHPDEYPIVKLGVAQQSTKRGDIPVPTLELVGWTDRPQIKVEPGSDNVIEEPSRSRRDDFDDEIPF